MDKLPDELLLHIFSYINPDSLGRYEFETGQDTFLALCLTSRHLRCVSQPFFYRILDFVVAADATDCLIRTLERRPDLARSIEFINLLYESSTTPWETVERQARQVLHYASKAQELFVSLHFDSLRSLSGAVRVPGFEPNGRGIFHVEHSRTMHTVRIRPNKTFHLAGLESILDLPALQRFEIRGCLDLSRSSPLHFELQGPGRSTITSIAFLESQLSAMTIRAIFKYCPALQHFQLTLTTQGRSLAGLDHRLNYADMDEAFLQCADTLESLEISFCDEIANVLWGFDHGVISSLRSLGRFSKLRRICLPINAIMNFDSFALSAPGHTLGALLPESIEEFSLCNKIQRHQVRFQQLNEFARQELAAFPNLRRISVCSTSPEHQDWRDLSEFLSQSGVVLAVE